MKTDSRLINKESKIAKEKVYQFVLADNTVEDIKPANEIKKIFSTIQELISNNNIQSGHDISSGGLITSILEMNFPNTALGMDLSLNDFKSDDLIKILFNESQGILIHTDKNIKDELIKNKIEFIVLGNVIDERKIKIDFKKRNITLDIDHFRDSWYKSSYLLDNNQT